MATTGYDRHSVSLCLLPFGPWGEALGPDTWGTKSSLDTLPLPFPTAHKCSQQVEGEARASPACLCQQEDRQKLALF